MADKIDMPEEAFVGMKPQGFVDMKPQAFVDMKPQGFVDMQTQGYVDMPETTLLRPGGGAEYRRNEAANLAELEKGYADEQRQRELNMYNLLGGDSWLVGRPARQADAGAAPPVAEAPKPPAPETADQYIKRMMGLLGGGVGAPQIKMNEMLKQGYAEQRAAQQGLLPAMEAEQAGKEQARAGILGEGAKYVEGLKQLQAKQSDLFGERRAQMAQDEAKLAQMESSFDANRVLRKVGENPIASGVLAFTAGLVGGLKGQAGDVSPNQIVQEVDKSIERDVMNQKELYSRALQGMDRRRTNYLDARQMGADEQQALATTAMASMDQHRRALEFAEARITDARSKAAVQQAIGALKVEQGKMQYQMDVHNASNALSASKANRDLRATLLAQYQSIGKMDPKTQEEGFKAYMGLQNDAPYVAAKAKAQALGQTLKAVGDLTPGEIRKMWDNTLTQSIMGALNSSKVKNAHDGDVVAQVISSELASRVQAAQDPREQRMLMALQGFVNQSIKEISGAAVSSQEGMRNELERALGGYDNFQNYLDRAASNVEETMKGYKIAGKYNPVYGDLVEGALLAPTLALRNWRQQQTVNQAAEDVAAGRTETKKPGQSMSQVGYSEAVSRMDGRGMK